MNDQAGSAFAGVWTTVASAAWSKDAVVTEKKTGLFTGQEVFEISWAESGRVGLSQVGPGGFLKLTGRVGSPSPEQTGPDPREI